jgi:hypothetical protein
MRAETAHACTDTHTETRTRMHVTRPLARCAHTQAQACTHKPGSGFANSGFAIKKRVPFPV